MRRARQKMPCRMPRSRRTMTGVSPAVTGWPVSTMVRGKFVVRDGKLAGTLGDGAYVPREKSDLARPARGRES